MQSSINPSIFRAFSIRGLADSEIPDNVALNIGYGIGQYFKKRNGKTITIGRDIRLSSERISRAITNGLNQAGLSVIDVGLVPTPILNFTTDYHQADGGVMITASHNPPDYNGLKIRADLTLDQASLKEIYRLAVEAPAISWQESVNFRVKTDSPIAAYLDQIKRHVSTAGQHFKIVLDGNHGTNGSIVPNFLSELGHKVITLNCTPDGTFPKGTPDPTADGATDSLSKLVRQETAALGFAYDGDGDRVVVVDELGQTVSGDQLLMLLMRDHLLNGQTLRESESVVYEVLCSQAVADDILHHGGMPIMVPSGYFYAQQAMQAHQAILGGELSGHFFFREPGFRFDDAILATIKTINLLSNNNRPLSKLITKLPRYNASPEVRLPCPDNIKGIIVEKVKQAYQKNFKLETLDGARIHFPDGWALVRQSNTQPILSMRFEARSAAGLSQIQAEVQNFVEDQIRQHNGV